MVPNALVTLECNRGGRLFVPLSGRGRMRMNDVFLLPGMAGRQRFTAFVNCVENVRTAMLERVFFHCVDGVFSLPHVPDREEVDCMLDGFVKDFKHGVVSLTPVPLSGYAKRFYRGRRLCLYQRSEDTVLRRGALHSDSRLGGFLKYEKLPVGAKRVVPRLIQPRTPEYNVAVGRFLRPLEHVIYRAIERLFGAPTVMKGFNASELGSMMHEAWMSYNDPCALGLDASRWDQHVSVNLLAWEHSIYDMYYRDPELRRYLEWQLHNWGFIVCADGGFKYATDGTRCSGDMNTALGNCLLMCAIIYSLLKILGLAKEGNVAVRLFNNGDDCVLIGERADIMRIRERVVPFFHTLGFVMKVEEVVFELEKVSFCQTQPLYDGASWRACRDPGVSLTKDATILGEHFARPLTLPSQLYVIGKCGLSLCGGLPVLQEYYTACIRCGSATGTVDERFYGSGFYQLSRGMNEGYREVTDAARLSFARAFDIMPDTQMELERYYRGVSSLVGPIHDREVERVPIPALGPWS